MCGCLWYTPGPEAWCSCGRLVPFGSLCMESLPSWGRFPSLPRPALSLPPPLLSSFLAGPSCQGSLEIPWQFALMTAAGHQRAMWQTSGFEKPKCPLLFGLIFLEIQASLSVRLIGMKAHSQTPSGSSFGVTSGPVIFPCHPGGTLQGLNRGLC